MKTDPKNTSGVVRSALCWTAPTSVPIERAKTAGSNPRRMRTVHQIEVRERSARGSTRATVQRLLERTCSITEVLIFLCRIFDQYSCRTPGLHLRRRRLRLLHALCFKRVPAV